MSTLILFVTVNLAVQQRLVGILKCILYFLYSLFTFKLIIHYYLQSVSIICLGIQGQVFQCPLLVFASCFHSSNV